MISWYAAYTRYGSESNVEERLNWQGFETYLPMFKKKFIGVKRVYYEPRPLFQTYVLVRVDLHRNGWGDILSTSGVRRLITSCHIEDRKISWLKSREKNGYITFDDQPKFHVGERVKVIGGVWFDNFGEIQYLDDRERAEVLLMVFGRMTPVQILSCHLEPADNQMTVNGGRSPQGATR